MSKSPIVPFSKTNELKEGLRATSNSTSSAPTTGLRQLGYSSKPSSDGFSKHLNGISGCVQLSGLLKTELRQELTAETVLVKISKAIRVVADNFNAYASRRTYVTYFCPFTLSNVKRIRSNMKSLSQQSLPVLFAEILLQKTW
jgi:hypothetical protein